MDFYYYFYYVHPLHAFSHCVVQSLSRVQFFVTSWTAACQASLLSLSPRVCSNSCPLSPWCHPAISSFVIPFSFCPLVFPRIRVFSNESALCIRWPNYCSFRFGPSNEYSELISFKIDWFGLLAVQGTLKSLLQHHTLKVSIFGCSAFFMI